MLGRTKTDIFASLFVLYYYFSYSPTFDCPHCSKDDKKFSSGASKLSTKLQTSDNYSSIPFQSSTVPSNNYDDDFDPRGTSSTSKHSEMMLPIVQFLIL